MSMNQLVHKVAHLGHGEGKDEPGSNGNAKASEPKSGSQSGAADDLKSLPIAEVE